jgi:subtilisin family serine protease
LQWNLQDTLIGDIKAVPAWDITTGSKNVVVAVIDSGIDYTHQDLAANMWRNEADYNNNGVDDDGNGYIDDCYGIDTFNVDSNPMDDNNHSTHVAGIIGAVGNNSLGLTGVAWNVKIMACKFMGADGFGTVADAIDCLEYVQTMKDRGVNIVATNNSWGSYGYSQALFDAVKAHLQRGMLFITAAGNGWGNLIFQVTDALVGLRPAQ